MVAHGVQLVGTVEGEDREVVLVLDPHGSVGHRRNLRQLDPARVTSNVADTVVPSAAFREPVNTPLPVAVA